MKRSHLRVAADFYIDVQSDLQKREIAKITKPIKSKDNFVGRFITSKEKEDIRKRGRPRKAYEGPDKNISQATTETVEVYQQIKKPDPCEYETPCLKKVKSMGYKYKKVISLGQVNFNISSVQAETKYTLTPQLLTLDSLEKLDMFPSEIFSDLIVESEMFSSSQLSLDYFSQCLGQSSFHYIIGWLYCPEFSQGKELITLARRLKSARKCLSTKFFDQTLGLTIMNNNVAVQKVFNQMTKWVLLEEYINNEYLDQLQNFSNLEALQPGLIFIIYTRQTEDIQHSKLDYQVLNYLNVFKMRQLEEVIESAKQKKQKQEEFEQQAKTSTTTNFNPTRPMIVDPSHEHQEQNPNEDDDVEQEIKKYYENRQIQQQQEEELEQDIQQKHLQQQEQENTLLPPITNEMAQ